MPSFGFSCTGGFSCFVNLCAGESEVPFGRSLSRFFVMEVGFGNACRFRFGRETKRNGSFVVRDAFLVRCVREDNRVSGCMSVAGLGARIHHRRMVQFLRNKIIVMVIVIVIVIVVVKLPFCQ